MIMKYIKREIGKKGTKKKREIDSEMKEIVKNKKWRVGEVVLELNLFAEMNSRIHIVYFYLIVLI